MSDDTLKEQRKAFKRAQKLQRRKLRKRSGGVLAGLLLLAVGSILLLKEFGFLFPAWLFTWPMLLVAFGLFVGAGNSFRDPGWVIITGIGFVFLLDKIWPGIPVQHFIWPIVIIGAGLMMIVVPRRHRWHQKWDGEWHSKWEQYYNQHPEYNTGTPNTSVDIKVETGYTKNYTDADRAEGNWLDVVSIFGNVKKMVYSKKFKGGDIVSIFGGAEVDLTQADFEGKIVIEMVQVFGGAKLIVPPHWQIRSEAVAIFGGIEDKRTPQPNYDTDKVVILNGTTFFGGIEIKSY